jgi:hypothetical protein
VSFNHPVDKSQHGTTCCSAYIEAPTIGLSPAMVTPSQILNTAAAAVAQTASMKSQQSRAPPAVGITCCAVHASTELAQQHVSSNSALLAQPHVHLRADVHFPKPGPTMRDIPPGTVSNGVCYLQALVAEDWPRCRHRRSCPCLVGTTPGTLHAAASHSQQWFCR